MGGINNGGSNLGNPLGEGNENTDKLEAVLSAEEIAEKEAQMAKVKQEGEAKQEEDLKKAEELSEEIKEGEKAVFKDCVLENGNVNVIQEVKDVFIKYLNKEGEIDISSFWLLCEELRFKRLKKKSDKSSKEKINIDIDNFLGNVGDIGGVLFGENIKKEFNRYYLKIILGIIEIEREDITNNFSGAEDYKKGLDIFKQFEKYGLIDGVIKKYSKEGGGMYNMINMLKEGKIEELKNFLDN